jgi:hypothetical protein
MPSGALVEKGLEIVRQNDPDDEEKPLQAGPEVA